MAYTPHEITQRSSAPVTIDEDKCIADKGCTVCVDVCPLDVLRISELTGRTPDQARSTLERKQPIGRLVTVDEVVAAILLCIDNAAMTGQGVNVDGGAVQS